MIDEQEAAMISRDTLTLCLELLAGVSVPVTLPDAEAKMARLVAARRELLAALTSNGHAPPVAVATQPGQ